MQSISFPAHSITTHPAAETVQGILSAALARVEPAAAVSAALRLDGSLLQTGERTFDLTRFRAIRLAAFGKAAEPMTRGALAVLGDRLTGGILVSKDGHFTHSLPDRFKCCEAGHPVPDERGVEAARNIAELADGLTESDLFLCLISGGGSALLTLPAPGISLSEIRALTESLLASGADIREINTIRRDLSQLKGGRLARLAYPATVVSLILSDVIGDALEAIASGPTAPSTTSYPEAAAVLQKYGLPLPAPILAGLRGEAAGPPVPGDPLFERVTNRIIGSNRAAVDAAVGAAAESGLHAAAGEPVLAGEAADAGRLLGRKLLALRPHSCLVYGGETTVTLGRNFGLGGRNQELALAAVRTLAGVPDALLITCATDGGDGPTDAAGAAVTGETLSRAQALGLNPDDFLARHDSYAFFDRLGDLIRTGPTQTNVNDLVLLLRF